MIGFIASGLVQAETPEPSRANDVALVSGQTAGAKSANLFSGFTDPGLTVHSVAGTKLAIRTDGADKTTIQSNYSCYDSEVSTFLQTGIIFLRAGSGSAYCLAINMIAPHEWRVGIASPFTASISGGSIGTRYTRTSSIIDMTTVPGYASNRPTDVITFGAVGFTVYVKYNGTTILSFKEYRVTTPGVCMIYDETGVNWGFGDTTITYLPVTMAGSNRLKSLYDIRDFGAKEFSTTGSITSASNQLVVADASGFSVGDSLIVETSSEAGLGLPGTMGVGGAWPALSYANTTAMNADTGQATSAPAWDRSSGLVYIWSGSAWQVNATGTADPSGLTSIDQGDYYTWRACPEALVATITAKSGTTLTLSTTASASVTNATVYFNCHAGFYPITDTTESDGLVTPSGIIIQVPNGNFALGQRVSAGTFDKHSWTVRGISSTLSKLFAPRGARNIGISFSFCNDVMIHTLAIEGNHKPNPSDINRPRYYSVPRHADGSFDGGWDSALAFSFAARCLAKNINVTDTQSRAVSFSACTYSTALRCTLTMNARVMAYTQWYFSASNCTGCVLEECTVPYSIGLLKAFETFVSTDSILRNCGGYNALCSTNNSYNWLYDGFYSDIYSDSFSFINAGYWGEAVMNINNNSFHSSSVGGRVVGPRIIQHGYCTSNNDTLPFLQVASDVTNVIVSGDYSSDSTPFVSTKGGYFEAPDYAVIDPARVVRSSGPSLGRGFLIEAPGTVVTGTRVVGASLNTDYNFRVYASATGSTITGNIADRFNYGATITKSNNRTNAGVSVP